MRKPINLLTHNGYMFVSVNYRLSPFPYELENPTRIQFPDHPNDVVKAIAFVMDNASEYGGDTDHVFLFGHSSGAHLVAIVLSDPSYLEEYNYHPNDIRCACILDTGGFELESWITESAADADLFINAFSDDPEVWKEASLSLLVSENQSMPDVLLVYQDNLKRIEANESYASIIIDKTNSNVAEISTTYDHQQINQLLGSYETESSTNYTQSILEWLTPCMSSAVSTTHNSIIKDEPKAQYNSTTKLLTILKKDQFLITDLSGKLIKNFKGSENETYSLSDLNTGIYIVSTLDTNWNYKIVVI